MLYNKNNVRKTNDKKILHKVGKQWKVVSVALLMAIGGGAAVAATNNANANADANNGVTQETQATVNSLEQGPQIGQSSAPASASSKAASASTSAPTMPSLSLNPDPSLNGNNASAEFARVKQGYDHAVVGYYGKLVNSYVNFVNSNYSASASSVNSNFASASNQKSNDASSANSFSAIAAGKNWSAEVSNIASAKSGVGASEYIETVQANVSSNSNSVSNAADAMKYANSVVSAASLVSEISANPAIQATYKLSAKAASDAQSLAARASLSASNDYNNIINDSTKAQEAFTSASFDSADNSISDSYAVANSGLDSSFVNDLASAEFNKNYSEASQAVSAAALASGKDGYFVPVSVDGHDFNLLTYLGNPDLTAYNTALGNDEKKLANAENLVAQNYNNVLNVKTAASSASSANMKSEAVSAISKHVNDVNGQTVSAASNMAMNEVSQYAKQHGISSTFAASVASSKMDSLMAKYAKGVKSTDTIHVTANGVYVNNNAHPLVTTGEITDAVSSTKKAADVANEALQAASNKPGATVKVGNNTTTYNAGVLAGMLNNAQNAVKADKANIANVEANNNNVNDAFQVLADTYAQQMYGTTKSTDASIMNSATSASAKYSAAFSSASAAMTSTSAKFASASSAYQAASVLAQPGITLEAVRQVVPSASAFFNYDQYDKNGANNPYGVSELLNTTMTNSSVVSSAVSGIASEANKVGSTYTSVSNSSENYAKSTDANFVLAQYYANSYSAMSSSDASAFNSASAAQANFYDTYAGNDFASDNDKLTSAKADEPNQGALANGYARYVQIHEPHVVTVTKQLVMHANPNYNDKTDTPADAKLAVINKGTHLLVQNVGFDKHGNTRLYVNYNGKKGFITGLRNYVADSYLVPGQKYNVVFNRTVHQYKGLQFNKSNATKLTVTPKETVTGTAVLNDDPHYWNGLTRLQLTNGNFVTTLDSMIQSATPVNNNGQTESKGAYFWNGQDNIFKK